MIVYQDSVLLLLISLVKGELKRSLGLPRTCLKVLIFWQQLLVLLMVRAPGEEVWVLSPTTSLTFWVTPSK